MYKLIGIRPKHSKMREMIGSCLFALAEDKNGLYEPFKVEITGILIGEDSKWKFQFNCGATYFEENEPLFASLKSLKRYAKKNKIKIKE